jgi:oxygen-independent coproporphyrinogen III oxidase
MGNGAHMSGFTVEPALLERYRTSAPRYTSYPTAVDWSNDMDPADYPARLARASQREGGLSVYLHLPFCNELCLFCGCNVVITRKNERVERYLAALKSELDTVKASGVGERGVRQYHWGGGTPTHLDLEQIERVHGWFADAFRFDTGAEMSIEVDPRVTTPEQVKLLASLGWNRISMGVQDFEATVQRAIKRVQSEAQTRAVIDAARGAGMLSVNIDLMYGLPHQTRATFAESVRRVIDIRPERVALFHYAHVPWLKRHQTALDQEAMPDSDAKLAIFIDALDAFHAAGYVYIGLDHFALPDDELAVAHGQGSLNRNFMGYTTLRGTEMISCGVSAIGEVDGAFVQNDPSETEYLRRVAEGGHGAKRGHVLTNEDRLRRDLIMSLMCNGRVDKAALETTYGIVFDEHFAAELAALAPMEDDGLVSRDPDALSLTGLGQLFMRNAALPFDRYYTLRKDQGQRGEGTFSKTL